MEKETEKVGQHFMIGMAANQLMPSLIKSGDIQSSLNNKEAMIEKSIVIAQSIVKQVVEKVSDENDPETIIMIASSASEALAAMIVRDPEGTFANIDSRTKIALDMVIELNKRVGELDESINQEEK